MEHKIKIGISNHHVHLTEETYKKLFDIPLEKEKDLNQIGEFSSKQFVTLKTDKNRIEKVRIVGPFRGYNQVELATSDAFFLGINPPIRKSGDLENSENITIIGPKGEINLPNSCIIAQRHVHVNTKEQQKYCVQDGQKVQLKIEKERSGILDVYVKVSDNGFFEVHLDRDEANTFSLKNGEEVTLIIS